MIAPFKQRVKYFRMDQSHALSFSLPTEYYDEASRIWTFNKSQVLQDFESLLKVRRDIA